MKKSNKKKGASTLPSEILFGLLVSIGAFLIIAIISSAVIMMLNDPINWIGVAFFTTFLSSAAISSIIKAKHCESFGVYPTLFSSIAFTLICTTVSLVMGGTKLPVFLSYVLYVLISLLFYRFSKRKSKRRRF